GNPDVSLPVHCQRGNAVVRQPVRRRVVLEAQSIPAADAAESPQPQAPLRILRDRRNEIVRQPMADTVGREGNAIVAVQSGLRANPDISGLILVERLSHCLREPIGRRVTPEILALGNRRTDSSSQKRTEERPAWHGAPPPAWTVTP